MEPDIHSFGRPLTAEDLKQAYRPPPQQLSAFDKLFRALCKNTEMELQQFHTTPVKCSVASSAVEYLPPEKGQDIPFRFLTPAGAVRIWCEADHEFDHLLGELCLGGNGMAAVQSDEPRPPSKFDKKLKRAAMTTVMAALPEAVSAAHQVVWKDTVAPKDGEYVPDSDNVSCLTLRVLVNAFALAGEIVFFFHRSELELALGLNAEKHVAQTATTHAALQRCDFEMQVFLQPQQITLERIMNITSGDVFPLEADIASPISIAFQSAVIFEGRMNLNSAKMNIEVTGDTRMTGLN